MGPIITAANRRTFKETYRKQFMDKMLSDEENEYTHEEAMDLASKFASYEVRREAKHLKAFIKGQRNYTFMGEMFPVLTTDLLEQRQQMQDITNQIGEQLDKSEEE